MNIRPLMVFTIAFTLGITIGPFMNIWLFASLSLTLILLFLVFTTSKSVNYLSYSIIAAAILFGAIYSFYTINKFNKSNLEKQSGLQIEFRAKISSEPDIRDKKINYVITLLEINCVKTDKTKVLLTQYQTDSQNPILPYGSIIVGEGKVVLPSHARNPGGFDYKQYLNSQGIYSSIICFQGNIIDTGETDSNPIIKASLFIKKRIEVIIDKSLPPNQAGLLKGMLIGDRNGLPESIKNDFNISGLTHIVCVSGANIAYIIFSCVFILGLIGVKKPFSNIITIFVVLIFMFITGCSPSVVRASIMGLLILLAEVFARKTDIYTSISTACLIVLLYNPLTFYDIGFQLSFAGTIGIVLYYKTLSEIFHFLPKYINQALCATLAAQITVCPIIALYFNKLSLIALLINVLVIPATGLITFIGFVTVLLGQFNLFIAKAIAWLNYILLSFVLKSAEISAGIPYASILVPTPSTAFLIIFYGISFSLLWYIPNRDKTNKYFNYIPKICAVIALISILLMLLPKPFKVFFLDIGQGDSIFIKSNTGQTCLIDAGGTYPGSFSSFKPEDTVIPFLLDNQSGTLDMAILSHPHGDHIQGLIKTAENINIKSLVIGLQNEKNKDLDTLLKICHEKNIKIIEVKQGDHIHFGNAEFLVIHPSNQTVSYQDSPLNNNSLVLKLVYNKIDILLTGDIQSEAESKILESDKNIHADILKIAHHGSPYSTTQNFLKKVSPSSAVISVGRNNFGHPADSVLQMLKQNNIKVFRTDKSGCITIEIYNKGYSIIPTIKN
ncbi:MAG: DNA internalization-related competence protein ComEC/Rec2 [Ignavibacteriales bacterium]